MTVQDIDEAFSLLSTATEEQLCTFDEMNVPWLPRVKGRGSAELAVRALRETVESCQVREERLELLGYFYCWMTPLQVLRPWTLMTLGDVAKQEAFSETALLNRIANAMKELGCETTFVMTGTDTLVYGCLLVQDSEPGEPAHVLCLCCWRSLSFMAVYATDAKIFPKLDDALTAVLGCDTEPLLRGVHEYLAGAYNAVLEYNGIGVEQPH
ncbi:hypothetical protein MTO96_018049 [Rhipicephalus appendiculatus]